MPGRAAPGEEDALEKPRIKRTRELLESAGDIIILQPADGSDVRIEQPDDETRALLRALDGTRSIAELRQRFGSRRVTDALAQLSGIGLLDDAAAPSEYQRRLRDARVLMLGLGGLGSWASYGLACCEIGELVRLDHDRVEPSNFNRQVLYREHDIGRLKAECAKDALAAFDSSCRLVAVARRLEDAGEVAQAVDGMDFVVASADWPAHDIERWVNAACFEAGVPFISMSHSPPVARVGPLYVPGETGCFECQETTYRETFPLYDELVERRRGRASEAATLGPVCAFVGGQVALETIHQLTGICPPATWARATSTTCER